MSIFSTAWSSYALLSLLLLAACGQPSSGGRLGESGAGARFDELRLTADNGHVSSPMSLQIRGDGHVELLVGGPAAIPGMELDRVGTFASTLSGTEMAELRRLVQRADIEGLERPSGPLLSGDYAAVTLSSGGRSFSRVLWQERSRELERLLDRLRDISVTTLEHPLSAIHVTLESQADAQGVARWQLVLHHLGSRALPLLLFDPAYGFMHVRLSFSHASAAVPSGFMVSRDAIVAAAAAGQIPEGVSSLAAGQRWVLPLTEVEVPVGTEVRGGVDFWLPGPGPARRSVRLPLGPTTLAQRSSAGPSQE